MIVETGTLEGSLPFLFRAGMFLNEASLGASLQTFLIT